MVEIKIVDFVYWCCLVMLKEVLSEFNFKLGISSMVKLSVSEKEKMKLREW